MVRSSEAAVLTTSLFADTRQKVNIILSSIFFFPFHTAPNSKIAPGACKTCSFFLNWLNLPKMVTKVVILGLQHVTTLI